VIANTKAPEATPPTPKTTVAAPVPRGVHEIQTTWLKENLGEPVKVALVTGKGVRGTLEAFDQFSLQVKIEAGDSVLVYKHAVAFLAPDLGE